MVAGRPEQMAAFLGDLQQAQAEVARLAPLAAERDEMLRCIRAFEADKRQLTEALAAEKRRSGDVQRQMEVRIRGLEAELKRRGR